MAIFEFLSLLNTLDINIWIEDGQLRYRAPEGVMTAAIKQELKERKIEILAFLKEAETATQSTSLPLIPVARDRQLPLSFAQQRMWFLHQLDKESPFYNESLQLRINGKLCVTALEQSINEIIRRHQALRTTFILTEGIPFQAIAPTLTITIPVVDLQGLPETSVQQIVTQEARKPFNLATNPLLRVTLLRQGVESHLLVLTMHHIITDGWSMGILLRELEILYGAFIQGKPNPLPELTIQYPDFALWQRQWLNEKVLEKQLDYWKQQLADEPALLNLPTDNPRPPVQTFSGATKQFQIESDLTSQLLSLSQNSGVTLFMTLLSVFGILLHRYSGEDDICIGSPFANRSRQEVESLIGFFVNTLVLRTTIEGNPTFLEFLEKVRSVVLDAHAHQDVPFEQVVEALLPERSLSYNPLFQVMFVLEDFSLESLELPGITLTPEMVERGTALFDLSLSIWQTQKGLIGSWEYNTDLFDAATIERMTGHFLTLVEAIVLNPQQPIAQLPILTASEQQQLLVEWNDTQVDYPQDKCIHQLFEEQVGRTPDAVAVVYENSQLTYHELNCRANQLAHYLRSLGVGADVLVGICVERSLSMVVGLLAILKAGGAYVPLDPEYPQERLQFMLEDAQVTVLLTQQHLVERLPEDKAAIVYLDTDAQEFTPTGEILLNTGVKPFNLAYVLYTSGSTGRPKAVAIEHHSPVALVSWAQQVFTPLELAGVLASTSICFDLSVFELFVTLSLGGKVDRRALPKPEFDSSSHSFVSPRNTIELQLAQIWSKILKLDNVGVKDNFFDLGGHSLLVPYLIAQIKHQFGKDIPLATLFQNPTIEQLITVVQKDADVSSWSPLVVLQPNGFNPPLFCLPGAGGNPFYLYNLARCLAPDQPFYTFQAHHPHRELPCITSVEGTAAQYIQAMQVIQPQGPYFLAGHSFGGDDPPGRLY